MQVLHVVLDFIVYAVIGAIAAWFYYYYRRRDLLGGFWVALVIGAIGAVIFNVMSLPGNWFVEFINFLMYPKSEWFEIRINLIVALAGAFVILAVFNHINHDKERR